MDLELPTPSRSDAPTYPLPRTTKARRFTTVEYPGPVSLASTSLDAALSSMTPLDTMTQALSTHPPSGPIELDLAPKNPYFHPIPATTLRANNLVVKLTKRRRRTPLRDEHGNIVHEGEYTIEPVGIEHTLVKFRAMADFQYLPKVSQSDSILTLVDGIRELNIPAIRNFVMPEPSEDYSPESILLPPPVFSRQVLPQVFDMKPAGGAVRITTESGSTRLVNSTRYKIRTMQSIMFVQPDVPTRPDPTFLKELGRTEMNKVEQTLVHLLEHERPVWTRLALLNQLSREDLKFVHNNKSTWPMIGYTFSDGPFRDLVIRFGYDPRQDPSSRFFQHFLLRNLNNVRSKAVPGTKSARQAAAASASYQRGSIGSTQATATNENATGSIDDPESNKPKSHIFDGNRVYSKIGNFQLIDIHDPLSRALIDSTEGVLDHCSSDINEGWYAFDYLDQIKQVVRRKFMALVSTGGHSGEGFKVSDQDCEDLLAWDLSRSSRREEPNRDKRRTVRTSLDKKRSTSSSGNVNDLERDDEHDENHSDENGDEDRDSDGSSSTGTASGTEGSQRDSGASERDSSSTPVPSRSQRNRVSRKVRAPWEQPRKKKSRPKQAETEQDMLARLHRKARRSTTAAASQSLGRSDSFNDGEEEMQEE
ncbi:transcription factor TFIIIC subunit TFC1 [Sporobolomyces koalae]|uniref:transcription factor TFIIIC subunit TFC1 n=1 Tax=Sporobolomyces koalae TaxID=500713 RepID=UPI00317C073E